MKKALLLLAVCGSLAACANDTPKIVEATSSMPDVRLKQGMATQVELPDAYRVQSVVVGNPTLLSAERAGNVVNLVPKEGLGETNLIIRSADDGGDTHLYQYRVIVQAQ